MTTWCAAGCIWRALRYGALRFYLMRVMKILYSQMPLEFWHAI